MLKDTLCLIKEEFRPQAAFNDVSKVASFHRIQCSPGIRGAANYINTYLSGEGIRSEVMSYPAKKGVRWWSQESFPEWAVKDAELLLLEDGKRERLCAFAEVKTSLIQRSSPTPPSGLTTSIVYIENATDPKAYEGIDVKGKLVFSRGGVTEIAAVAVDRFGAAGIIVDTMREHLPVRDRFTLADGRQYLSFWPANPEEHKAFGFVVTPRQGEMLRSRLASGKKELAAFARVDSEYRDGSLEVVSAVIPGETDEEVVAVAHVCHPEPSANDNASGCGTLMESVRTLFALIRSGRLPKPRRTIRFLWVPEMTGSYAFLANHEANLKNTVAAINLDMVGENQDLCGSTFTVERPITALAGFGGDLAASIIRLMSHEVGNYGSTHSYATFRWTVSPYSGGSDHNIWGDPNVGVTCPMLIQWPDRFYHTSEDTIDKVDPKMLGVAGVLTSTYLYTAATANSADAAWLAGEMAAVFASEADEYLSSLVEKVRTDLAKSDPCEDCVRDEVGKIRRRIERRAAFLAGRKSADIASLLRMAPDSPEFAEARSSAQKLIETTADFLRDKALRELAIFAAEKGLSELVPAWQPEETDALCRARNIVPQRVFRGPFSGLASGSSPEVEAKAKEFSAKHPKASVPSAHLQYWADGKRTLAEIADLLECETGYSDIEALVDYYDLMVVRGVFQA